MTTSEPTTRDMPSAEVLDEYHRMYDELKAAARAGEDTKELTDEIVAFMVKNGFGDNGTPTGADGEPE